MPEVQAAEGVASEQVLRDEIVRLNKIITALMNRAERSASNQRSDFGVFQTTLMLEGQVRDRIQALEQSLRENEKINRALQNAKTQMDIEMGERRRALVALEHEKEEQRVLIKKLEDAHNQLLQSEKMASIGHWQPAWPTKSTIRSDSSARTSERSRATSNPCCSWFPFTRRVSI